MSIKMILKTVANGLLTIPFLLVLSTVFVVSRELENGVVSGKYFWFFCSISLTALTIIISFLLNRRKERLSPIDWLLLLFCLSGVLFTYFHDGLHLRLVLLVLVGLLYCYFRLFLSQWRWNAYVLTLFFLVTGLSEAIWGLSQLYGFSASQHSLFRTTGSFFNPGPFAGYLAMVLPGALYFMLNDYRCLKRSFNWRYTPYYIRWGIAALTLVVIIVILPTTMSRASWLGSLAGCLVVAVTYLLRQPGRYHALKTYIQIHKKALCLIVPLVIALMAVAVWGVYLMKKDSADGRALMWKISSKVISHRPMGVGMGNFAHNYGQEQAAYFASGQGSEQEELVAGNPEYAFNEYLQIGVEFGVIPLCLWFGIIVGAMLVGFRRRNYAAVGMLLSVSVFAAMSYPFNLLPFVIAVVFLLALCLYQEPTGKKSQWIPLTVCLLFALCLTAVCVRDRYPSYDAYKKWRTVKFLHTAGHHKEAARDYAPLMPYLNHEIRFLFEYAQSLAKAERYEESIRVLEQAMRVSCDPMLYNVMGRNHQALQQYAEAEQYLQTAAAIVPSRLYPYYLLTKLYDEMGEADKVLEAAAIVQTKEPKVQSPAVREMREEVTEITKKYENNN